MKIDRRTCPRNWRLYHLLDLNLSTSAQQVKWNFRKVSLRKHYNQAYHVLSNSDRKPLYDTAGEEVLGFITSGTWGPFVPTFGAIGSTIMYCVVLLLAVALLILFFALLAVRIDSIAYISWRSVAAPLMGLGCLMVLATATAVLLNLCNFDCASSEFYEPIDRFSPVGNFLASVAYACIPFVLVNVISSNPARHVGSYMIYMTMPIVGDVLYYLTSLIWRWPSRMKAHLQTCENPVPRNAYWGIFIIGILTMLCCIAQWVVLGLKLDGYIHASWYVVFIPFCVRALLRVLEARIRSYQRWLMGLRSYLHFIFDVLAAIFVNGLLLTSLYLVAVYIERHGARITFAQALIPVYVVLGYIFLALLFTLFYVLVQVYARIEEEYRCKAMWKTPIEQAQSDRVMYNYNLPLIDDQQLSIQRADDGYDKYDDAILEGRQLSTSFNDTRDNAGGTTSVDKDAPRSTAQSNGEKNDKMTGWGTDEIITPVSTAFESNSHKISDPTVASSMNNHNDHSNTTTDHNYSVIQVDDGDTVSRGNVVDNTHLRNNYSAKPDVADEFEDYTDNDVAVYPEPANGVLQEAEQPPSLPGANTDSGPMSTAFASSTKASSQIDTSTGAATRARQGDDMGRWAGEAAAAAAVVGAGGYASSETPPMTLIQPESTASMYGATQTSVETSATDSMKRIAQRHRDPAAYCTDPRLAGDSSQMYSNEISRDSDYSDMDYGDDKSDYTASYTYEDEEDDDDDTVSSRHGGEDDYESTSSAENEDRSGSYTNSYTYDSTYVDEQSVATRSDVASTKH